MLRIFLILIIFISASSATLLTNTYLSYQQSRNTLIEQDKKILNEIRNNIITNIIDVNGIKMVPYGINGNKYHELPSWLYIQRVNSFGIPYMYCPYSDLNITTSNNIVSTSEIDSYDVTTINNITTNNRDYVFESEPPLFNNVIGIIISQHERSDDVDCSSIIEKNGIFISNKALVSVIYKDSILFNDLMKDNFIQVQNDTGSRLNSELTKWNSFAPYKSTYELRNSLSYNINSNLLLNNTKNEKVILNIKSDSTLSATISSLNGNEEIEFRNVDLYVENINFSNNLKLKLVNSTIKLKNTTLNNIELENSLMVTDNVVFNPSQTSTNNIIDAYNSKIILNGLNTFNNIKQTTIVYLNSSEIYSNNGNANFNIIGNTEIFQLENSKISFSNKTLSLNTTAFSLTALFVVDNLSSLSLNTITANINNALSTIYLSGKANISNSLIQTTGTASYGIILNDSSILNMNNSDIGNTSIGFNVGIHDQGGLFISGAGNNVYYQSTCEAGRLFNKTYNVSINDNTVDSADPDTGVVNPITVVNGFSFDIKDDFNKYSHTCNLVNI